MYCITVEEKLNSQFFLVLLNIIVETMLEFFLKIVS